MEKLWKSFHDENNFCDMTLVCEDKQIRCHKAIVSSCSPILKDILKESSIKTPFIIIEGLKFNNLQNIISFIYKGQVDICEKELGSFLTLAQDLKIKGLADESKRVGFLKLNIPLKRIPNDESVENLSTINDYCNKPDIFTDFSDELDSFNKVDSIDDLDAFNDFSDKLGTLNKADSIDELDALNKTNLIEEPNTLKLDENLEQNSYSDKIKIGDKNLEKHNSSVKNTLINYISALEDAVGDFELSNNSLETFISKNKKHLDSFIARNKKSHICKLCDKQYVAYSSLRVHIQTTHEGKIYSCKKCPRTSKDWSTIKKHNLSVHMGILYSCDQCEHKTSNRYELKKHIDCKHSGILYPCKTCNFKATNPRTLRDHTKIIHQGVRYECDKCDFVAKNSNLLGRHKDVEHLGISYPCTDCDYFTLERGNLKRHILKSHKRLFYPCNQCDYEGKLKRNLKIHLSTQHKD